MYFLLDFIVQGSSVISWKGASFIVESVESDSVQACDNVLLIWKILLISNSSWTYTCCDIPPCWTQVVSGELCFSLKVFYHWLLVNFATGATEFPANVVTQVLSRTCCHVCNTDSVTRLDSCIGSIKVKHTRLCLLLRLYFLCIFYFIRHLCSWCDW